MPQNKLDLGNGSIVHIENFRSHGYDPKDKYLVIFANEGITNLLAFTITTTDWTRHPYNAREVIEIPQGTVPGLPKRCWIKCFHEVIRLNVQDLENGFRNHSIKSKGTLPASYLKRIRNVIECSDILSRMEIEDCLAAIDQAN